MRKSRRVGVMLGAMAPFLLLGAATSLTRGQEVGQTAGKETALQKVRDYKRWTKVNPTPLKLPVPLDELCRNAVGEELIRTSYNPHRRKFFTVYVNETGRKAMLTEAKPAYPVGTTIVKEKLKAKEDQTPELMTVMVKREKGFDPPNGDWEYLVVDGAQKKAEGGQTETAHCKSCHAYRKANDYVFRTYLPEETKKHLR